MRTTAAALGADLHGACDSMVCRGDIPEPRQRSSLYFLQFCTFIDVGCAQCHGTSISTAFQTLSAGAYIRRLWTGWTRVAAVNDSCRRNGSYHQQGCLIWLGSSPIGSLDCTGRTHFWTGQAPTVVLDLAYITPCSAACNVSTTLPRITCAAGASDESRQHFRTQLLPTSQPTGRSSQFVSKM